MSVAERVPDLLRSRASAAPDHVALVVEGRASLTYAAWQQRSSAVASGLRAAGVVTGDRVALLFDNAWWTDYAVCYVAVHLAGAVAVPLSSRFSEPELGAIVAHAQSALLVSPPELAVDLPRCRAIAPHDLEAAPAGDGVPPMQGSPELAEILYTSGTTSSPKGVACTHASILAHDLPPAPPGEASFLHAFPVATNAGQECLRMPLRRTTTAVVLERFDPELLCAAVAKRRIRRLQLVPAMAQLLLESGAAERFDLSSVDRVTLSSAPAPPGLWARLAAAFDGAELFNAYALTESGGARTLARHDPAKPRSVGRPVGETEIRVVDADGVTLPAGETGEIWLRRPGAPQRAYYRDAKATAGGFTDGWLRTGDRGFMDGDGDLILADRLKDVIITGGLNVSALDVEDVLHEHPAVLEASVFGVPHVVLGEDVAAAVVARQPVQSRALQAFVRSRLGEHQVPHRVVFVASLPRNPSGKVVKRELCAWSEEHALPAARAPVRDGAEATVVAIFEAVLGRSDVGVHDDFFDLGGHSLAAAQVSARLGDAFGTAFSATAVFELPTAAELAAAVASPA